MQKKYLYSITTLLLIAAVILFFVVIRDQTSVKISVFISFSAIICAIYVLWHYDSKIDEAEKEREAMMRRGPIYFELTKSYANNKVTYTVKYNPGNGGEIAMGSLEHIADTIKTASIYRSYRLQYISASVGPMQSVDTFAESNFFTPTEIGKLNSLLERE